LGYYAAYLDVGGRRCLVTGGGQEAAAKAEDLVAAGAQVVVIAEVPSPALRALAGAGSVELRERRPVAGDLDGVFVAVDASGDEGLNVEMRAWCDARHVLLNILDRPAVCDFIAPALVRRGPLQVAVSTAGRSPFMASLVRRRLEGEYDAAWGEAVELVGRLRDRLRAEGLPVARQQELYAGLDVDGAVALLRAGDRRGAEALLGL